MSGVVVVCEACKTIVDPNAADVEIIEHWQPVRSMGDQDDQWVQGVSAYFHKRHQPRLGQEWRGSQ